MSATTGGIAFRGVVRGEWVKLRSLRSSVFTVLAAAAVLLGVGLIFAATMRHRQRRRQRRHGTHAASP